MKIIISTDNYNQPACECTVQMYWDNDDEYLVLEFNENVTQERFNQIAKEFKSSGVDTLNKLLEYDSPIYSQIREN